MCLGMYMYVFVSAEASPWAGCQWREGQRTARGLSPFLWFNMTPLALRLQQLHMHMPAILFVVEDYSAIKAPVSSSVAGLQNYCFTPSLESFFQASRALQKHRWGSSFWLGMNGSILLTIIQATAVSHHLSRSVKGFSSATYVRIITQQKQVWHWDLIAPFYLLKRNWFNFHCVCTYCFLTKVNILKHCNQQEGSEGAPVHLHLRRQQTIKSILNKPWWPRSAALL